MNYVVTIGGRTHQVVVDGDQVEIGGRRLLAELRVIPGTALGQLILPDSRRYSSSCPGPQANGWCRIVASGTRSRRWMRGPTTSVAW